MYADGVEEDVIAFLKDKYPDAWKKAVKEAEENNAGDFSAEESVIPSMIWSYVDDEDDFFSSVENWFKEKFPEEFKN
jgi:hypothetical protein